MHRKVNHLLTDEVMIRRIESAIRRIGLDLRGQTILTEAASGPFMVTPIIAAMAGATKVFAVTRNSRWGSANEIRSETLRLASSVGVASCIEVTEQGAEDVAATVDVVTNLGFVRPISRQLIERLPADAAIGLMWEPWEFRAKDIDLAACVERGIPVVATNEQHPEVATLRFVGLLALKLLLEAGVEVLGLNLIVIGSNPFGRACVDALVATGAKVKHLDPYLSWPPMLQDGEIVEADAIVVVEHRYAEEVLGGRVGSSLAALVERRVPIIHICGLVDYEYLSSGNCQKYPANSVPFGHMTVTTAHVGVKPVVDLHCAGLHATSIVARARKTGASVQDAVAAACASGYGLSLESPLSMHLK